MNDKHLLIDSLIYTKIYYDIYNKINSKNDFKNLSDTEKHILQYCNYSLPNELENLKK